LAPHPVLHSFPTRRSSDLLTTEAGVAYFLVPGNHEYGGGEEGPNHQMGVANYLRAVSGLIPPEGSPRRLSGYATYSFGYGNVFRSEEHTSELQSRGHLVCR